MPKVCWRESSDDPVSTVPPASPQPNCVSVVLLVVDAACMAVW
jgi:hypothetical protein